jgi:hypothetical protein
MITTHHRPQETHRIAGRILAGGDADGWATSILRFPAAQLAARSAAQPHVDGYSDLGVSGDVLSI